MPRRRSSQTGLNHLVARPPSIRALRALLLLGLACAVLVTVDRAAAQTPANVSLTGRYYFVQLLVDSAEGQSASVRNLGGVITFDGSGRYTYSGKLGIGSAGLAAAGGQGQYSVAADGSVTLTSPARSTLEVRAWMGAEFTVLLGAGTETRGDSDDIFVAVRAPAPGASAAPPSGAYTGASLSFPNATDAAVVSALVSLTADGAGRFTRVSIRGHSAGEAGRNSSQEAGNATFNINREGAGTASFGNASALFSGDRDLFVSADGNYMLSYSTAAGTRDIFVAVKNADGGISASAFAGAAFRIAELTVFGRNFSSACGTLLALGNGRALISERVHLNGRTLDYSGINYYALSSAGSGRLSPDVAQDFENMAAGAAAAAGETSRATAFVGAEIGKVETLSDRYGIFLGVRALSVSGAGSTLEPGGIVNAATFAPAPSPVSPGVMVSVFGSHLASQTASASALPLPTTLGGVSVTVNGVAAPLFFVSPAQVNLQAPNEVTGLTASFELTTPGGRSNPVRLPLAPASPGVFSYADDESPHRGTVFHADDSLVTPQKPARPGETLIIYLTGLGRLSPAVRTGEGNPTPPAVALEPVTVLFGGEVAQPAFAGGAPGLAGLNQINAVVPLSVLPGPRVPLAVLAGNAFTDIVDIPIGR